MKKLILIALVGCSSCATVKVPAQQALACAEQAIQAQLPTLMLSVGGILTGTGWLAALAALEATVGSAAVCAVDAWAGDLEKTKAVTTLDAKTTTALARAHAWVALHKL